jgi:hypothetical protein
MTPDKRQAAPAAQAVEHYEIFRYRTLKTWLFISVQLVSDCTGQCDTRSVFAPA